VDTVLDVYTSDTPTKAHGQRCTWLPTTLRPRVMRRLHHAYVFRNALHTAVNIRVGEKVGLTLQEGKVSVMASLVPRNILRPCA